MKQPDNAGGNDTGIRRRLIGFFMFPIALFPFLALWSYDWHRISDLCTPPNALASNLIGVAGDWFAYTGYQLLGLGIWAVPLICVFCGLRLVLGRSFHPGRRTLGVMLFLLAVTCLLQIIGMRSSAIQSILTSLNIVPNAGGAVGYLLMTRCLARLLSPFGSGVLMASLAIFSILLTVGFRNIIAGVARVTAWAADREREKLDDTAKDEALSAAEAAREAAQAEREAEKQRIADEKAAAKAAKEAAKEERRREREAAQAARDAERQAKLDAQRRIREAAEAPRDFFPAREDIVAPPPQPVPAKPVPAPVKPATPQPIASNRPETAALQAVVDEPDDKGPYILPPVTLLNEVPPKQGGPGEDIESMAQRLVDTLKVFDVNAELAYYVAGPVVTQYALTLDLGTRVERVAGLARNLQMALQAKSLPASRPPSPARTQSASRCRTPSRPPYASARS